MYNLSNFPFPHSAETTHETKSKLFTKKDSFVENLSIYPEVNFENERLKLCKTQDLGTVSAFLENKDSLRLRLIGAWYKQGLVGILVELSQSEQYFVDSKLKFLPKGAQYVLSIYRWLNSPHLSMSAEDLVDEFSPVRNWRDSHVRCIAWHPQANKLAVVTNGDELIIHILPPSTSNGEMKVRKHPLQKTVADIAWKPFSASVIAVACQTGILVWNITQSSSSISMSSSHSLQILTHPNHSPVISLAWNPHGNILASACPIDKSIILWNVVKETNQAIRHHSAGVTFLRWSPDASRLFAASASSFFRIWECVSWQDKKWLNIAGRCQACCWSADGSSLLYAGSEEPIIYLMILNDIDYSTSPASDGLVQSQSIVPVINLQRVQLIATEIDGSPRRLNVGGCAQSIAWDSRNERLAISFKESSSDLIALFQTKCKPKFECLPCGFIRGRQGEIVMTMTFKPSFDGGSLLTVVWSSGRVCRIPLYYAPRTDITSKNVIGASGGEQSAGDPFGESSPFNYLPVSPNYDASLYQ